MSLYYRPQREALGNKPLKLCSYSPAPRTEVYCFRRNSWAPGGILIYRNSLIINHDVAFNKYSSQSSRLESGFECHIVSVVLIYYCLIVKIKTDCNHDAFIQVKFPNMHCA